LPAAARRRAYHLGASAFDEATRDGRWPTAATSFQELDRGTGQCIDVAHEIKMEWPT